MPSLFSTYRLTDSSTREHCQVELANTFRIGDGVDGDDLAIPDGEVEDHQEPPPWRYDDAHGAVDENRLGGPGTAHNPSATHGRGAAGLPWCTRGQGCAVGSQNDVRVEHREQRLEVAAARGGEERVDDVSLAAEIDVGHQVRTFSLTDPMYPAAGPAGKLPRGVGSAPNDGSDLVEGHGEHVMQHEGEPLGGSQGLQNDQQRQADRVGQQRFVLRVAPILSPPPPPPAGPGPPRHMRVQRLLPP